MIRVGIGLKPGLSLINNNLIKPEFSLINNNPIKDLIKEI